MATFKEDPAAYMRARRARLKAEAEQAVASGNARKPIGIEARRARQRAEQEAHAPRRLAEPLRLRSAGHDTQRALGAPPVVDPALPRSAIMSASDAEVASVKAKIAAIGGRAVITRTDGKLDAMPLAAFEARQNPRPAAPAPVRALAPVRASTPVPTSYKPSATPVLHGEVVLPPRSMIASGGTPPERYARGASIAEVTASVRALAFEQGRVNAEMAHRLAAVEKVNVAQAAKIATLEEKRSGVIAIVQGATGLAMSLMFGMRED
jgi:hypothetical protein